ncbi:MAG: hypothetical protein R6V46_01785 [Desulfatiglandaceae bacterium]
MTIEIDERLLEQACKKIIETILLCLPNAFKGTVYLIGKPPEMIAKRITSGVIDQSKKDIAWGLPEKSEYNPPGKPFTEYRDEPGRPLEAMGWCVEKQRSWTAEDPTNDIRSVSLQLKGVWEDFHHMEPVLIRKQHLYAEDGQELNCSRNAKGEVLWRNSEYVVIAVIKIHFLPKTIRIDSPETRIIKSLSRSLGTELLSYQLRQESLDTMNRLAREKLESYNILADSLRNAITKSGLIFSLIKLELGFLREQWERILLEHSDQKEMKREAVCALERLLSNIGNGAKGSVADLIHTQNKFLNLSLPPEQGEKWVAMQIEARWNEMLGTEALSENEANEVRQRIDQLKRSLHLGSDPEIVGAYAEMPEGLKRKWVDLIYRNIENADLGLLNGLIRILEDPALNLPHKEKSKKSIIRLKALAEIMGQLENRTNAVLKQVFSGNGGSTPTNTFLKKII